jgi:uncharacterized membrane protein
LNDEIQQLKKFIAPKKAAKKSYFKKGFFKGLAGILPAMLTIVVLVWCYQILRDYMGVYVNGALEGLIRGVHLEKAALSVNTFIADNVGAALAPADPYLVEKIGSETVRHPVSELKFRPLVGIGLSLVLIYILGSFISSYIGKKLFPKIEKMFLRIPIVKAVYPYARQVTDFFLGEQTVRFERIVAVEYPRRGMYSLAFITNEGFREVSEKTGKRMVVAFVPSSPTPITGYTVLVPADEVIPLDMTIDDALRMVITGGVILPEGEKMATVESALHAGKVPPLGPGASGKKE